MIESRVDTERGERSRAGEALDEEIVLLTPDPTTHETREHHRTFESVRLFHAKFAHVAKCRDAPCGRGGDCQHRYFVHRGNLVRVDLGRRQFRTVDRNGTVTFVRTEVHASAHSLEHTDEAATFWCGIDVVDHQVCVVVDGAEHAEEGGLGRIARNAPLVSARSSRGEHDHATEVLVDARHRDTGVKQHVLGVGSGSYTLTNNGVPGGVQSREQDSRLDLGTRGGHSKVNTPQCCGADHLQRGSQTVALTSYGGAHERQWRSHAVHGASGQRGVPNQSMRTCDGTHDTTQETHRRPCVSTIERFFTRAKSVRGPAYRDQSPVVASLGTQLLDDPTGGPDVFAAREALDRALASCESTDHECPVRSALIPRDAQFPV